MAGSPYGSAQRIIPDMVHGKQPSTVSALRDKEGLIMRRLDPCLVDPPVSFRLFRSEQRANGSTQATYLHFVLIAPILFTAVLPSGASNPKGETARVAELVDQAAELSKQEGIAKGMNEGLARNASARAAHAMVTAATAQPTGTSGVASAFAKQQEQGFSPPSGVHEFNPIGSKLRAAHDRHWTWMQTMMQGSANKSEGPAACRQPQSRLASG